MNNTNVMMWFLQRCLNSDTYFFIFRILAADRGYPFGTMVRITTNDSIFLGIVLDRGSAIGFNKIALFDLLYP